MRVVESLHTFYTHTHTLTHTHTCTHVHANKHTHTHTHSHTLTHTHAHTRIHTHIHSALIDAHAKRGLVKEAAQLFDEMLSRNISPDSPLFVILIDMYGMFGLTLIAMGWLRLVGSLK